MRKIKDFSESRLKQLHKFYDNLAVGICIQKYLETEDGKGDYLPIYANKSFADSMGIPGDLVCKMSLRSVSPLFPDKELQDMKETALKGLSIKGENFSADYTKFFTVNISQYEYGYLLMTMSDVTTMHINDDTLHSVSKSFERIYYIRLRDKLCSRVYPLDEANIEISSLNDFVAHVVEKGQLHPDDKNNMLSFLSDESLQNELRSVDEVNKRFRMKYTGEEFKWYSVEVIVNERDNDGVPTAYVVTIKSIDKIVSEEQARRAELEAAYDKVKKANESKKLFLKNMSHDLRTPINGVLGMVQVLEKDDISADLRQEYVQTIKKSTENLLALFTEILELTRFDSSDSPVEKTCFNIHQFRKTMEAFGERYDGVKIDLDFPEFKHPYRLGAEEYLRQIGWQLVNNAIKFNKDNNPIEVVVRESENSDEISLTVIDHGIGISDEFKPSVFEPFAQEKIDSRTFYEGAGLGLAYVKRVCDELGATIFFESTKGEGSSFTVRMNLDIDYEKEKEITKFQKVDLSGKKVLVVEDNEINMMIAECFLKGENMICEKAENGKVGLDKFVASAIDEYDLILMDIMMPVMDGLEATKAIRESNHPNAKSIPIIAVSANSFPEDIQKGIQAGTTAYVAKPYSKSTLFETIEAHICA